MIYSDAEKIASQNRKEKDSGGIWRNPTATFIPPLRGHPGCTLLPYPAPHPPRKQKLATYVHCFFPRGPIRDSVSQVYTRGYSNEHHLPRARKNSRLSAGKLVLRISHAVRLNNPGPMSHPDHLAKGGNTPEIIVPRFSHEPALPAGLSKDDALGLSVVILFSTGTANTSGSCYMHS